MQKVELYLFGKRYFSFNIFEYNQATAWRIKSTRPKAKTPRSLEHGVLRDTKPDDNLLSHWLQHYHRRNVVSRSCSGWEGVVPTYYGHQA